MVTIPRSHHGCGEMLSMAHAAEKAVNRQILFRFLACQGLALRGDGKEDDSRLMKLSAMDDPRIMDWLKKKSNRYMCPEIQNELLKVMSMNILREITKEIQGSLFLTIMTDEATDHAR